MEIQFEKKSSWGHPWYGSPAVYDPVGDVVRFTLKSPFWTILHECGFGFHDTLLEIFMHEELEAIIYKTLTADGLIPSLTLPNPSIVTTIEPSPPSANRSHFAVSRMLHHCFQSPITATDAEEVKLNRAVVRDLHQLQVKTTIKMFHGWLKMVGKRKVSEDGKTGTKQQR